MITSEHLTNQKKKEETAVILETGHSTEQQIKKIPIEEPKTLEVK